MACRYVKALDTQAETWGDTCTRHGQPWPCPCDPDPYGTSRHHRPTGSGRVVRVDFTHRTRKDHHR